MKSLSRVWLFVTPWTIAHYAPPSMNFLGKNTGVGCHLYMCTHMCMYIYVYPWTQITRKQLSRSPLYLFFHCLLLWTKCLSPNVHTLETHSLRWWCPGGDQDARVGSPQMGLVCKHWHRHSLSSPLLSAGRHTTFSPQHLPGLSAAPTDSAGTWEFPPSVLTVFEGLEEAE